MIRGSLDSDLGIDQTLDRHRQSQATWVAACQVLQPDVISDYP